jgi:hypothetical protein
MVPALTRQAVMSGQGQKQKWLSLNGMSALPPKADVVSAAGHVG